MSAKISAVINSLNDEENIGRVIRSVKWADEILVCDMYSSDSTALVAKKLGAKVISKKEEKYVELARDFAISKTSNEWILILDPDEEVPESLANRLKEMVDRPVSANFIEIPRKNLIFNKWMKASMWWPDYNIRFFRKGNVSWEKVKIHRPPKTIGEGLKLPQEEEFAIVHHHYTSISQFIERLNRYTDVQAKDLKVSGYKFMWSDLLLKPLGEFLSRYFANRGFEDGLHGLALSLLQAFSFLVVYLKVWEMEKFKEQEISFKELAGIKDKTDQEIKYWFKYGNLSPRLFKSFFQRVKNKLT